MRNRRKTVAKTAMKITASTLMVALGLVGLASAAAALPTIERLQGGTAWIRASDGGYRNAAAGDVVGLGEAVLLSARSRLVVRCPDNTRRRVTPGRLSGVGIICPTLEVARRSRDENDLLLLSGGRFPYVVRMVGDVAAQEWAGDRCGPENTPAAAGDSTAERLVNCAQVEILPLTEDAATELAMGIEAIEASGLATDTQSLALAYRYAASGVHGDVVNLLEPLLALPMASATQPAAVYQLLADSYLQLGWVALAQQMYGQAEQLAVRSGDYETRLVANLGLAKVAAWRLQPEQAVDYLWAALRDVGYVRDREHADMILQWLGKLE